MLRSRVIPCLLIHNKGLVKTIKFQEPKYVGDPINAVKILNEKEVDELVVLDIDATVNNVEPDYELIAHLAAECRMPFCYGGGVKTAGQAKKIIQLGVEKIALSSAAIDNPEVLEQIGQAIGCQSVVVVVDVKKSLFGGYDIYTHNGKRKVKKELVNLVQEFETLGIGELVINSIDNDGVMKGYDLKLADRVRESVSLPITFLGGAGSIEDIAGLVDRFKLIGAAAGSLFVFKGKYRAVLINYLSKEDKERIFY
ncbi:imidazole glycerol phosphate synthase subunit HisF [Endozoicomonas sp. SM1973]|uniref:imidazole glycerol-phosphate synthase n=1 Tax=Spartinivicinus marinus TaxID=2994442 RepID=A0A853IJ16_9GAMM|nr:AglZ/HisF2 family acetamidino modification protein [Spartinivicinus marinus]MCX4028821.1 AglZ/HisF2 family acetamidino modification protein [Spartinivicinus marinus]NYZ67636.1 imidazole glycerol phosphate synthase subunit HisF [Spartinivicinus marinus]